MLETEDKRTELAATASAEEISQYVQDPSPKVIRALLGNRQLTEEDILIVANRKNIPADILEIIARDKRWSENYPVRLALARNPKSPLSVSLSIARFLRLFDLEEITRSHFIRLRQDDPETPLRLLACTSDSDCATRRLRVVLG